MIAFVKHYLGWRNWAVLTYNSIFENLFVIFYIGLRTARWDDTFLFEIIIFILFSIFSTTYGYLINDYADIDLDKAHGKDNTFKDDAKPKAIVITMFFLGLSILCGLPFSKNMDFALLWLFWIFISTFYSLPPIRFKERGKVGLIFVVFAQRLIPILLVFTAFNFPANWEMALMAIYVFFRGASSDINHQYEDYENDVKTGTATFAVEQGKNKIAKILRFSFEAEKFLLALILGVFVVRLGHLALMVQPFLWLTALLYLVLLFYSFKLLINKEVTDVNPFKPSGSNVFQFLHHSYPSVILATSLNFILIYYNWYFFILFLSLGYIRGIFSPSLIRNSFIYHFILRMFKHDSS